MIAKVITWPSSCHVAGPGHHLTERWLCYNCGRLECSQGCRLCWSGHGADKYRSDVPAIQVWTASRHRGIPVCMIPRGKPSLTLLVSFLHSSGSSLWDVASLPSAAGQLLHLRSQAWLRRGCNNTTSFLCATPSACPYTAVHSIAQAAHLTSPSCCDPNAWLGSSPSPTSSRSYDSLDPAAAGGSACWIVFSPTTFSPRSPCTSHCPYCRPRCCPQAWPVGFGSWQVFAITSGDPATPQKTSC